MNCECGQSVDGADCLLCRLESALDVATKQLTDIKERSNDLYSRVLATGGLDRVREILDGKRPQ